MANLNFDERRRERGQAEPHRVTVAGQEHELPPVLPTAVFVRLAEVIAEATGGDLTGGDDGEIELDAATMMAAAPKLIDALADHVGSWVNELDFDEVMAVLNLYGLAGEGDDSVGEASAS